MESVLNVTPRPGRLPVISKSAKTRVVNKSLQELPAGATHWSRRTMARDTGLSESTIGRIWRNHGLKPHLLKTFKLSNAPNFVEKLEDIVALYLSPPEHALVFSCDEKSQVQALDRTQPGLPLKKGRCATTTHDYKRKGTTSLFAAMNTLDGSIISKCMKGHRHIERLKFLKLIKAKVPAGKDIHVTREFVVRAKHLE